MKNKNNKPKIEHPPFDFKSNNDLQNIQNANQLLNKRFIIVEWIIMGLHTILLVVVGNAIWHFLIN